MGQFSPDSQGTNMKCLVEICAFSLLSIAAAAPQFVAVSQIANTRTGELIDVNADNIVPGVWLVPPVKGFVLLVLLGPMVRAGSWHVGTRAQARQGPMEMLGL